MPIQITDAGSNIRITVNDVSRLISKANIQSIRIVENSIRLGIEGCCGSPFEYLPFAEVTSPLAASIEALRDLIGEMISAGSFTAGPAPGVSTEAKQNEAIGKLEEIKTAVSNASTSISQAVAVNLTEKATETTLNNVYSALFSATTLLQDTLTLHQLEAKMKSPLRTETVGNITYEGYADPLAPPTSPMWTIKRITTNPGSIVVEWANFFSSNLIWNNRESYVYA